jgi:2,4-dienoyl-CoA reductase-like NADH-dependent reductase (Old Yellow Enzyme family)
MYEAVRAAWPEQKPLGIRVSATDWVDGGWTPEETVLLAKELKKLGMDYMDVSPAGSTRSRRFRSRRATRCRSPRRSDARAALPP